jgi:hypothetical protein
MNPEHGGKIELRLERSTAESADYAAQLQTPRATFVGRARVGVGIGAGQVELEALDATAGEPPEWLAADARAALRAALRTAQAEGRWPRRITRWRPEPEG